MDKSFKIRQAILDDIDTITTLRLDFLRDLGTIGSEKEAEILTKKSRDFFLRSMASKEAMIWFIEKNNKIVSTGAFLIFKHPPLSMKETGVDAYIFNIYTLPEFRRMGLATEITHLIMEEARKVPCMRVWLHATGEGILLYEKLGFKAKENVMEFMF
ncbi:MAG: GNAT family N-acetyltransferase [Brevinematales bacterium]